MGFFGKLFDYERKSAPDSGTSDPSPTTSGSDPLFGAPPVDSAPTVLADPASAESATPTTLVIPPVSASADAAAPIDSAAMTDELYTDMGLRYVITDPKTGAQCLRRIGDYNREIEQQADGLGISPEQLMNLKVQNGTLRAELFYLDSSHREAAVVEDKELADRYFADYDRRESPPEEPAPAPAPAPAPVANDPGAIVKAIASLSEEDRAALAALLVVDDSTSPAADSSSTSDDKS